MVEFFEIEGTHIRYADIKDFRIIQREYIFRPTYTERTRSGLGSIFGKKYEFSGMQPYAAIEDERSRNSSLDGYKVKDMKEGMVKDLFDGAMTTIGDKFNIKALRAKKLQCVNKAGRRFTTYLEDIPAVLYRNDGKVSDVQKNDELYGLLGEPIAPSIIMVDALLVKTNKERFSFYGESIDLPDVQLAYQRLSYELDAYTAMKKEARKIRLPKFPRLDISSKKGSIQLSARKPVAQLTDGEMALEKIEVLSTDSGVVDE